jgi:glycosyltransferase involved in cell wall biosynthesis
MTPRLRYFMHVPWGWIKQRPHFLAEHLGRSFRVTVYPEAVFRGVDLTRNPVPGHIRRRPLLRLPAQRFAPVYRLNAALRRRQAAWIVKDGDYVWLTHPALYPAIAGALRASNVLIYDCMDDAVAFAPERGRFARDEVRRLEAALCERADHVLCSATHLRDTLAARYGLRRRLEVVPNGVELAAPVAGPLPPRVSDAFEAGCVHAVYVGTIAEWFDFDLVLASLRARPDLRYLLLGPAATRLPRHERMRWLGPVPHDLVTRAMARADVLVMPFMLNDVVRSVDPVKVYEYIHAGRPALVRRYGETEKFDPYVRLYDGAAEYLAGLEAIAAAGYAPKLPREACQGFLQASSWASRAEQVARAITAPRASASA